MTALAPGAAHQAPRLKFWQTRTARFGGSALILALLLTCLPFHQVWFAIERIPPSLSLGLLIVWMFLHLLGVVKWRMLVNVAGADLSFAHAVRCYYGGLFGNVFLPSLVGGDVVRGAMAFPVARSKAAIVMGSLIDRTQDVIGLGAIAGMGALLLPSALNPQSRKVFLVFAGALAFIGLVTVGILFTLPVKKFPFRVRRGMAKLRHAGHSMVGHWGRVLFCLGLGIVLQVSQIALNCWLGIACGMHVSFGVWLFAWPLAKISALLPLTQGGIGVREAALVALLIPFGVPAVLTAAAGLVFEAITTVGGLLAGIVAIVVGRLSANHTSSFPHLSALEGSADRTPLE
jgi:uncharacterized membrane protein YbhN (UPF0104 family)